MVLTDVFAENADIGTYKDDDLAGLYLSVGKVARTWYYVGKAGGKTLRVNLGRYPDVCTRDARRKAKARAGVAAFASSVFSADVTMTVDDLWQRWTIANQGKKSLYKDAGYYRLHLAPHFGGRMICDITVDDVRRLKGAMLDIRVTFNRVRSLLSAMFNFARQSLALSVNNPCGGVEKYPETPRRVTILRNDAAAFFAALDEKATPATARDIIYLLLYVGLRPGEAYMLKKSWVDFSTGVLAIPASDTKTGAEYISIIPPEVLARLEKRLDGPGDRLFPPERKPTGGRPVRSQHVTTIRKALLGVCRRAGISEIHPHDLRRTYGTWQLNAGVSMEIVSKNLHHKSIAVTQAVYADILVDRQRIGSEAVRGVIAEIRGKE